MLCTNKSGKSFVVRPLPKSVKTSIYSKNKFPSFLVIHMQVIYEHNLYLVSGISIVTPIKKDLRVRCAQDPEYSTSAVVTMWVVLQIHFHSEQNVARLRKLDSHRTLTVGDGYSQWSLENELLCNFRFFHERARKATVNNRCTVFE